MYTINFDSLSLFRILLSSKYMYLLYCQSFYSIYLELFILLVANSIHLYSTYLLDFGDVLRDENTSNTYSICESPPAMKTRSIIDM